MCDGAFGRTDRVELETPPDSALWQNSLDTTIITAPVSSASRDKIRSREKARMPRPVAGVVHHPVEARFNPTIAALLPLWYDGLRIR